MSNKNIDFIKNFIDLTEDNYDTIDACLGDFKSLHENERDLVSLLKEVLDNESIGTEMSSVLLSTNSDSISDDFMREDFKIPRIVIGYGKYHIVLPEKIAIQIIIDWCAKNTTHPDIPALCEKLKEKYGL